MQSNATRNSALRPRLSLRGELMLALLPTLTILAVLALLEVFSQQHLLFASLASSAFLIYLDPQHEVNSLRTLTISQSAASVIGFVALSIFGAGYSAAAVALILIIALMIVLNAMHPPAVSTALTFAFKNSSESSLVLFAIGVALVCLLVALQQTFVRLLARHNRSSG